MTENEVQGNPFCYLTCHFLQMDKHEDEQRTSTVNHKDGSCFPHVILFLEEKSWIHDHACLVKNNKENAKALFVSTDKKKHILLRDLLRDKTCRQE